MTHVGGHLYESGGVRDYKTWSDTLRSHVGSDLTEAAAQHVWANVRGELAKAATPKEDTAPVQRAFVETLGARMGLENAANFVNDLQAHHPGMLDKLIAGEPTTVQERQAIASLYRDNMTKKLGKAANAPAMDTIRQALAETKKRTAPPQPSAEQRTAGIQKRSEEALQNLGKPAKKRVRDPRVDIGVYEYAQGARNLNAFARRIKEKYPDLFTEEQIQDMFRGAAQKYKSDYKKLDDIKRELARTVADEVWKQKSPFMKGVSKAGDVWNMARALQTSVDVSAPGRQGALLVANNAITRPRQLADTFAKQIGALGSQRVADAVEAEIQSRPNAQESRAGAKDSYYDRAGLYFAKPGAENLTLQEEAFRSNMAENLWGVGRAVKASERAYSTFLNKLRADNFDAMVAAAERGGVKLTDEQLRAIGNTVNAFTGRGKLPGIAARSAEGLGALFYSPRNFTSRLQTISGEPLVGGLRAGGGVGKVIAKEYMKSAAGMATLYGLAMLAGGKVNRNMNHSDFGKIRFGNNVIDPLAGLAQPLTFLNRMFTGRSTASTGRITDLVRGKQGHNRAELATRFVRGKLAPLPGAIWNMLDTREGIPQDLIGQPTSLKNEIVRAYTPMSLQDVVSAARTNGFKPEDMMSLLSFLGVGYSQRQSVNW